MALDRREFVRRLCIACAGAALPLQHAGAAQVRAPLSTPRGSMRAHYDAIVVGSGYGGSVMAARLARTMRVAVVERGREWSPHQFPATASAVVQQIRGSGSPLGLFDYRAGAELDVLVGNGLGGTSLINANVVVAPDADVFAGWPAPLRDAYAAGTMRSYEATVRQMLAARPFGGELPRKAVLHASTTARRARAGAPAAYQPLDLAVHQAGAPANPYGVAQAPCSGCGDCVSGCRTGAKNTLDVNYLALARQRAAEIYVQVEVESIERLADRWRVHYVAHRDGAPAERASVTAQRVVLSAGALGSTAILLRSRAAGLPLSAMVGRRVSANGDYLGVAYNTDVQSDTAGHGETLRWPQMRTVGPTITGAARYRAADPRGRFLIEEGAWPSALVDALRYALPPLALDGTLPQLARAAKDLHGRVAAGALNHSMVYLGIGHDSAGGRIELDSQGQPRLRWPGIADEPFVRQMQAEMEQHARAFGGTLEQSPRSHPVFGGALTTVHPLGGAPVGVDAGDGVADHLGRVFDPRGNAVHDGLYVVDGALLRGSIGVNPLLTIAAIAERCAASIA